MLFAPLLRASLRRHGGQRCTIPKIIHQTWKNDLVSYTAAQRIRSWLKKNPEWTYMLWTNDDNRRFMAQHYPEHTPMFLNYSHEIKRADAIRYFLLHHYGGLYVDLDFEALRPVDPLLAGHELVIGQEPWVHSHVLYDVDRLICNAFMASCARHPFWEGVHAELRARRHIVKGGKHVMDATGPRMLNDAVAKYEATPLAAEWPLYVPDYDAVYPYFDAQNPSLRSTCDQPAAQLSARRKASCARLRKLGFYNAPLGPASFAVHHWQHSWVGFGYFDVDSVNATELVAKVRAGKDDFGGAGAGAGAGAGVYDYGGEPAWNPNPWDGIPGVTEECEADKKRLCSDVKPGGGRTHKCLEEMKAKGKLSPDCEKSKTFVTGGGAAAYEAAANQGGEILPAEMQWGGIPGVTEECEADKKRLCSDVKPGGGRTHKCLEEMKAKKKLSPDCEKSKTFVPIPAQPAGGIDTGGGAAAYEAAANQAVQL
eukprot:g5080.t1